jgi:hypothetical protein
MVMQSNRTFTVAERKRAMGFPDDFRLAGTPEDVRELAACTVSARHAYHTITLKTDPRLIADEQTLGKRHGRRRHAGDLPPDHPRRRLTPVDRCGSTRSHPRGMAERPPYLTFTVEKYVRSGR